MRPAKREVTPKTLSERPGTIKSPLSCCRSCCRSPFLTGMEENVGATLLCPPVVPVLVADYPQAGRSLLLDVVFYGGTLVKRALPREEITAR